MQSQIILLSNVKHENVAQLVQKEFEMFGITNIKGKRIDSDKAAIHKTVAEALADYNIIMVIGGIGEKNGNMTVSAVSSAVGFSTVEKDGEIFPESAEIFRNKDGKPSGCAIAQGNQCIIMIPGESETLQFMLCYRVSQYLADFVGGAYSLKTLRASGISKSETEDCVSEAETAGTAVRVYEDGNEIAVQIYGRGTDRKEAAAKVNEALKDVAAKMGAAAYAVGAENVGQAFGRELSKKDLKAAIAVEGIQRNEITSAAFTEEYLSNYLGTSVGVSKYELPEKLLKRHGSNSTWTAAVLAGEVCKTYGSNIGIAITTDPSKNNDGANIAVCMGDNVWTEHVTAETREKLISVAGTRAVHLARCVVSAYPKLYENSVSFTASVSGKAKFKTSESKEKQKWYARFIPMKGDSKSELIRKAVFILCVLVFLGSMGYLSTKLFDSVNHRNLAASLSELLGKTDPEFVPNDWEYNPKLYDLYRENSDTIGYISIDGTNVAFPVVQTEKANDKGNKGQYYLRKDFYGAYSMYGTPFLDYRCNTQTEIQSKNLIVYGHNVYNDGQMFSDLVKYRQLKFYKEHPVVHFDTLYGDADWLVVGVVLTNAYEKDGPVWNYNNFIEGGEEETKEFLNQVAKRTLIVTGVDYNTSDHFLTLSTCSYDFTDARVVVIARQVREGEDISLIDTSKAYYNSNPLMPDKWYQAVSQAQQSEADASFGEAEEIGTQAEIVRIEIERLPDKTEYKIGEKLKLTGLSVLGYHEDETFEKLTEGLTIFPEGPFDTEGDNEIFIMYEDLIVSFIVKVSAGDNSGSSSESSSGEAAVSSIEILTKPNKLEYKIGEKIDITGLVVRVYKEDNSYEDVTVTSKTEGFSFEPKLETVFSVEGEQTIKVTYDNFSAKFTVKVTDIAVKSIEILKKPNKLEYTVGEALDTTGLVIRVTKENGSTEDITTGFSVAPSGTLNTEGNVTVTVTYKEQTATFDVTVKPASSSSDSSSSSSSSTSSSSSSESSVSSGSSSSANSGATYSYESPYYAQSTIDTVKVNGKTLSVYDAVCQIVAFEAGQGQPDEHVKAQAVASYTYLMYNKGNISAGVSTAKLDSQIKRCVAEVIGYAVLDDRSDKYILATYFSESCGETADAEWVWGYYNRNLLSVSSSVDGKSSKTYKISSKSFADKISNVAGISLSGDPSGWVSVYSRFGSTSYVDKVNLDGTLYSARKLRESVLGSANLRSTAFDVTYDKASDCFVFTMRGYGHGVGMSAVGSIAYAKQGYEWDEILLKYYSNCYIGIKY